MEDTKKGSAIVPVLIIVILLLAGGYYVWQKAVRSPGLGTTNGTASSTEETQNCTIVVDSTTTIFMRPSKDASTAGEIASIDQNIIPSGETADGWIGFDPGSAQAPNVGPFRLRYIPPNSGITLVGKCSNLPIVPNLAPKQCFVMAETDAPIYAEANASSTLVATMHFGDYIEAYGKKGKDPHVFIKVLSTQGTLASGTAGYVSLDTVNYNGTCALPGVK